MLLNSSVMREMAVEMMVRSSVTRKTLNTSSNKVAVAFTQEGCCGKLNEKDQKNDRLKREEKRQKSAINIRNVLVVFSSSISLLH